MVIPRAIWIIFTCLSASYSFEYARYDDDDLRLRNLDIGPCMNEGDAYCTRRVANSFCSVTKNECFCQPSFVAIQEEYGITCKPLLTSLNCHVDKDCVHVHNSICHPGAGFCACPGGTIFAPQSHACRNLAERNKNGFCEACHRVNGACFYEESQSTFGCACPFGTTNLPNMRSSGTRNNPNLSSNTFSPSAFCKALLVDIGGLCNQVDMICRSKHSECSSRNGNPSTCRCILGFHPFYQKNLNYHECFPEIPRSRLQESEQLVTHPGVKFLDINGDGKADEHLCPTNGSSFLKDFGKRPTTDFANTPATSSLDVSNAWPSLDVILEKRNELDGLIEDVSLKKKGHEDCTKPLVHVACSPGRFNVCFFPPSRPPYQQLHQSMVNGIAIAFLSNAVSGPPITPRYCVLKPSEFLRDGGLRISTDWEASSHQQFCASFEFSGSQSNLPCGVQIQRNETMLHISAVLEVRTDARVWSSSMDHRFGVTCNLKQPKRAQTSPSHLGILQAEGSWNQHPLDDWSTDNIRPTPAAINLGFNAISPKRKTITKATLGDPIQFMTTLFDPTGLYKTLAVEECTAKMDFRDATHSTNIIKMGCPRRESGFTANFHVYSLDQTIQGGMNYNQPPSTIYRSKSENTKETVSLISSTFPAFILADGYKPEDGNLSLRAEAAIFPENITSVNMRIVCGFRLCANSAWCNMPRPCSPTQSRESMNSKTTFLPPRVHFVVRSLALEVIGPSPNLLKETIALGSQTCRSIFCQPRVQLVLIMTSLGTMLCLSMICGCLVSRNQSLFHSKRPSSTSTSNTAPKLCSNFFSTGIRHSSVGAPKVAEHPQPQQPQPIQTCDDIGSFLTAGDQADQNYIQFYSSPSLPHHMGFHTLPQRRYRQMESRSGLLYANGDGAGFAVEVETIRPTLLVPVTANHHVFSEERGVWVGCDQPEAEKEEEEVVVDGELRDLCIDETTATTTHPPMTTFANMKRSIVSNNENPLVRAMEISPMSPIKGENKSVWQSIKNFQDLHYSTVLENTKGCIISPNEANHCSAKSPASCHQTTSHHNSDLSGRYRLPRTLFEVPEFAYCVSSPANTSNYNNENVDH